MELFLVVLICMLVAFFYFNRNWIKYMWKEHFCDEFPVDLPPFCMDCKEPSCENCKAKSLWKKDPNKALEIFFEMNKKYEKPLDNK